jgi:hypothetical protein
VLPLLPHDYPTLTNWQSSKSSSRSAPTLGGYPPTSLPKQDNTLNQWRYLLSISDTHRSSVKKNRVDFLPCIPGTTLSTLSQGLRNPSTARYTPPRPGNGLTSADGSMTCWPEGTSNTQTQTRLTSPLPSSTSRRRMVRTGQSKTIEKRTH